WSKSTTTAGEQATRLVHCWARSISPTAVMVDRIEQAGDRTVRRSLEIAAADQSRVNEIACNARASFGGGNRPPVFIPTARPGGPYIRFSAQELATGSIENIEHAIAIRVEKELSWLPTPHPVHENQVFGGIPIERVVGRELI